MSAPRPSPARRYAAALAVVGLLALAGCGGGSADDDAAAPSAAPSATETTTPEPSSSAPPTPYAAVPGGVTLTEPGTELQIGDPATAAWLPGQDTVAVVELAVLRVEQTTLARTFRGFRLSGAPDGAVPYLVTSQVTNVGETDIGGRRVPLYARDGEGRLVEATAVPDGFRACPRGALPKRFGPGTTTRSCRVYLVPGDTDLVGVSFVPPAPSETVTWLRGSGASDQPSPSGTASPSASPGDGSPS